MDERATVTVLFADISGFTALADRLDPDSLHEILGPVISAMAEVAERHGGYIAKYAGDALLVLFGHPVARDDDAYRALEAAHRMHGKLERMVPDLPEIARELSLHIGLDSGQLAEGSLDDKGDRSLLGGPITIAQRLESLAGPGETYVGAQVYELARHRFTFEALGELTPKDGTPLQVWRLASQPAPAPGTPVPVDEGQDAATAAALRAFVSEQMGAVVGEGDTEERRLVTVLFADFTGLSEVGLDPDDLHRTLAALVRRLAHVAERYDAFVPTYAGDAVLAFFGAPVAHEDDSERALLVALEMHAELQRALADVPSKARTLRLRVGVNSGHVISGRFGGEIRTDYSILGDAVNLAQRFQSVAPPGETYVGEVTARLTRGGFELDPVGRLRLKGKARPVPAWRLIRQRTHREPSRPRAASPFLGRESELSTARLALARLEDGRGSVVGVTGEPGVGKSRLTEEVRRIAEERGARWLSVRCISYGSSLPYWPYADLLRRSFGIRIEDQPSEAAARLADDLGQLDLSGAFPFFASVVGLPAGPAEAEVAALEPEAFRRGLHRAFESWVRALARQEGLALVIEDLHWADASSVELTTDVFRLVDDLPLFVYVTSRTEGADLLREIAGVAEDQHLMELRPLGSEAIGSLVESILDGAPPRGFVEAVIGRTGGNPFFLEELIRSLVDAGALARVDGRWRLRGDWSAETVPATVEGVLASRIDLLPRDSALALQTASVIGRRVILPLLRAITNGGDALDASLERLIESGFLDPASTDGEDALVFHHALVQEVAYSRLVRRRRRELHLKVAERAETLYGAGDEVVDLLARHYYLGDAGARALGYLLRAGDRARHLFANEEAIVHFERAAEICRGEEECNDQLPQILLDLADLHDLTGNYDEALAKNREVIVATNHVRAWRGAAGILRKRGQYDEALSLLDQAFGVCQVPHSDLAPLWLERGWTNALAGRYGEGIEAFKSGLEAGGDHEGSVAGELLSQLARAELIEGRPDEALGHALEARGIFERANDLRGQVITMRVLGDVYIELQRLEEAEDVLRRGLQLAERIGNVEEMSACLINLGFVEMELGHLREAIALTGRAAEEVERLGHQFGRATAYANLATMLMRAGDLDEAEAEAQKALEVGRSIGYTLIIADAEQTMASLFLLKGDADRAGHHADEAARLFLEMSAPGPAAEALAVAAEARERAGNPEGAAALREQARSLSGS